MKLISWNVNGVRAAAKKGFVEWLLCSAPDILCIQETKAHEEQLDGGIRDVLGYRSFWCAGEKKGYSGVGLYSKRVPSEISFGFGLAGEFDSEGRIIVAEYPEFTLLNIYFPNGQMNDERLRYKLGFYDATLAFCENLRKKGRSLIICGDYNTAHGEIDLARPDENSDVSGFLRIERDWMDKWEAHGYADTFRKLHPAAVEYSWWSMRTNARARDVGWRLDYFYVTPDLLPKVKKAAILKDVQGSDHCPVLLEIDI